MIKATIEELARRMVRREIGYVMEKASKQDVQRKVGKDKGIEDYW